MGHRAQTPWVNRVKTRKHRDRFALTVVSLPETQKRRGPRLSVSGGCTHKARKEVNAGYSFLNIFIRAGFGFTYEVMNLLHANIFFLPVPGY